MNKNTLSKESSKKLFDLGLRLETEKYWIDYPKFSEVPRVAKLVVNDGMGYEDTKHCYPAPSVGELMEVLPDEIQFFMLKIQKNKRKYFVYYEEGKDKILFLKDMYALMEHKSLAEALFLMLEYLINNNLMEVK